MRRQSQHYRNNTSLISENYGRAEKSKTFSIMQEENVPCPQLL